MHDDLRARPAGRIGVREVARAAGVSTQTVSRVLNDHPGIRDDTRQRVLDAMQALDYRVNNAARALGTRRTRTIGILVSDAAMYGPATGVIALEAAARAAGRWVTAAYADAADESAVVEAVQHLQAQGVDGVVVLAPHARTMTALTGAAPNLPVIGLHGADDDALQRDAASLAVAHLAELGHERIGHLAGPDDWFEALARAEGFDAALAARGLRPAGVWRGDWSAASGFAAAAAVARAAREGGPTAVFAANDQMALGLIAGLADQGIAVPARMSVVGVDDNPDAAFYRPALTTVRLDIAGEAARCIAAVLGLDPPAAPAAPALLRRASSAPAR
ncbi:LacI family DNA-binding transcriptional regulator [uncultured Microbacterium sp.]|uniref:LacI family DNA-binding transcriptional regulator n=1 Tax=uncultured Microbacterium sp. TaxID=191216 RepID=UPI0028D117A8|nr:LacI family DNA-binding transcriptional regulator [uncultured Microbacterium sp.]